MAQRVGIAPVEKKPGMAEGMIGGLIGAAGTVIGSAYGGPAGGAVGGAVGSSIGNEVSGGNNMSVDPGLLQGMGSKAAPPQTGAASMSESSAVTRRMESLKAQEGLDNGLKALDAYPSLKKQFGPMLDSARSRAMSGGMA
jgi:hypothetical protein